MAGGDGGGAVISVAWDRGEVMIDGHSIIEWYWNETAKVEEDGV